MTIEEQITMAGRFIAGSLRKLPKDFSYVLQSDWPYPNNLVDSEFRNQLCGILEWQEFEDKENGRSIYKFTITDEPEFQWRRLTIYSYHP
jgi:hypothetical protein